MTRTANVSRQKATGSHYTPLPLGRFVARRILAQIDAGHSRKLRVLDPACGTGALLEAFETASRGEGGVSCEYVGVEADEEALHSARIRLSGIAADRLALIQGNFLEMAGPPQRQTRLWGPEQHTAHASESFDVVIANPPYVRTQVLGAVESRRLAERFNLSGRVDLYQAFLVAATTSLRLGGIMGIIISNRFLTTITGASVRRYLAEHYDVCEIIDLGDTKLFEAAVLPAIVVGRRKTASYARFSPQPTRFMRIYSTSPSAGNNDAASCPGGIYDILELRQDGIYRIPEGVYIVSTGTLDLARDAGRVWSLATPDEALWIQKVRSRAAGCFEDIAQIRVGIKTTADSVFIRSDWESMPDAMHPESSLLLPLLSHQDARRWARKAGECLENRVLYPHQVRDGERVAIDLAQFPRARHYLQSHQARLRGRHYVAESGRKWYEIWVPQDPSAWAEPKIVFPDISPEPRFFLDVSGSIVNGNCYWITLRRGVPDEFLYLLLGLANSNLMTRFHDLAFANKLYAGRRRYITQYVSKYPYPDPASRTARELVEVVHELVESSKREIAGTGLSRLESQVERLSEKCFGLKSD